MAQPSTYPPRAQKWTRLAGIRATLLLSAAMRMWITPRLAWR